jgi:hypothetical protein
MFATECSGIGIHNPGPPISPYNEANLYCQLKIVGDAHPLHCPPFVLDLASYFWRGDVLSLCKLPVGQLICRPTRSPASESCFGKSEWYTSKSTSIYIAEVDVKKKKNEVFVSFQSMREDFKWCTWKKLVQKDPLRLRVPASEKNIIFPYQTDQRFQTKFGILDLLLQRSMNSNSECGFSIPSKNRLIDDTHPREFVENNLSVMLFKSAHLESWVTT